MREWKKPELYVEELELSQHVAAGCGVLVPNTVYNGVMNIQVSCRQQNGNGHYNQQDVAVYDVDRDGKISNDELQSAVANLVARNGQRTGIGHMEQHGGYVITNDGSEIDWTEKPFNS